MERKERTNKESIGSQPGIRVPQGVHEKYQGVRQKFFSHIWYSNLQKKLLHASRGLRVFHFSVKLRKKGSEPLCSSYRVKILINFIWSNLKEKQPLESWNNTFSPLSTPNNKEKVYFSQWLALFPSFSCSTSFSIVCWEKQKSIKFWAGFL